MEKDAFVHQVGEGRTKEQYGFLKLVLESLPHPFYVIDASDYKIKLANTAAQFGPLTENSTCYSLTHKRDKPCGSAEHPCPVEEIKKTRGPVKVEHLHLDSDGNPRNAEVSAFPIFDSEGNVSEIIQYSLDITERKRSVEALRESEAQYRRLVENMNDGLAIHDKNRLLSYVNRRFLEIIGFQKDEVVGHAVTDFLDETNQRILEDQVALRRNGERKPYELVWNHKDGRKIPTIVSPERILDRDGQYKGSFAVVTEITELKRTEQALKEREKELEIKTQNLEEANVALKVLLQRIEEDKVALQENVLTNTKELIAPFLTKLMNSTLDERQKGYADVMETNLNNITSSFARKVSSKYLNLTPTELRIANLVREGKTTKEIATLLHLSGRTIESHRKNMRKKLGLTDKKANLRTKLLSLQ